MTIPGAGETVTRLRPGTSPGNDRYGSPLPGADSTLLIPGCLYAPDASTEPVAVGRTAVVTSGTVYMPVGVDLATTDRLMIRGVLYTVEGAPAVWQGMAFGGVAVSVKQVSENAGT